MTAPITLLTDFGHQDPFVGIVKGVIAGIAPGARVIDICHGIPPQDVTRGGICWMQAVPFFPAGSIHVAVIDPGVGGPRRVIAARGRAATFLAPDNGILGYVLAAEEIEEAVCVTERRFFLREVSATFHGRDVFAPVAARLALGVPIADLGPPAGVPTLLRLPSAVRRPSAAARGREEILGEVIDVDRFGNCLTSVRPRGGDRVEEVRAGSAVIAGLAEFYGAVDVGRALAIVGSSGFVEIAVREGRADKALGLSRGAQVTVVVAAESALGAPDSHGKG